MRVVVLSITFRSTISIGLLTNALMRRLAELPELGGRHNVCHVASNFRGERCVIDGFPVAPLNDNGLNWKGADMRVVAREILAYQPDLVIAIFDARGLAGLVDLLAPVPLWIWAPIDSCPISPLDLNAIDGAKAISMSKFGFDQLELAGVENRVYVPAGIDPAFTVNTDQAARAALRAHIAGPDCTHLTGLVARYYLSTDPDRKAIAQQLRAWAMFAADKPGARLYCHVADADPGCIDGQAGVFSMVRAFGLVGRVVFPQGVGVLKGATMAQMAQMYGACDVLLHATAAEGFGLPIVEAQACGSPVVCTDWTAMPELVRWGTAVKPLDLQWVPSARSFFAWPDVWATTDALQVLYNEWTAAGGAWPLEQRLQVSAGIHAEYGWGHVFQEMWAPLVRACSTIDKAHSDIR